MALGASEKLTFVYGRLLRDVKTTFPRATHGTLPRGSSGLRFRSGWHFQHYGAIDPWLFSFLTNQFEYNRSIHVVLKARIKELTLPTAVE